VIDGIQVAAVFSSTTTPPGGSELDGLFTALFTSAMKGTGEDAAATVGDEDLGNSDSADEDSEATSYDPTLLGMLPVLLQPQCPVSDSVINVDVPLDAETPGTTEVEAGAPNPTSLVAIPTQPSDAAQAKEPAFGAEPMPEITTAQAQVGHESSKAQTHQTSPSAAVPSATNITTGSESVSAGLQMSHTAQREVEPSEGHPHLPVQAPEQFHVGHIAAETPRDAARKEVTLETMLADKVNDPRFTTSSPHSDAVHETAQRPLEEREGWVVEHRKPRDRHAQAFDKSDSVAAATEGFRAHHAVMEFRREPVESVGVNAVGSVDANTTTHYVAGHEDIGLRDTTPDMAATHTVAPDTANEILESRLMEPEAMPRTAVNSARLSESVDGSEARIQLRLEEAGPVEIRAVVREDAVSAEIATERPNLIAAFADHSHELADGLRQHELRLEALSFGNYQGGSSGSRQEGHSDSRPSQHGPPRDVEDLRRDTDWALDRGRMGIAESSSGLSIRV